MLSHCGGAGGCDQPSGEYEVPKANVCLFHFVWRSKHAPMYLGSAAGAIDLIYLHQRFLENFDHT